MSTNQLQTEISHWDLYRHFSAWSSVNGLPHIILTNSACLRLIWTSITFFAFFAGLYQTGSLINDYYSYPVNLKTNVNIKNILYFIIDHFYLLDQLWHIGIPHREFMQCKCLESQSNFRHSTPPISNKGNRLPI